MWTFRGFGPSELPSAESTFKEICSIDVDDGVVFLPDTVRAAEIRKEANYAGIRITLLATLDGARCHIQADIGFADAVIPGPQEVEYPTILKDFSAPKLHTYPRYTVVAEKFEALSKLGMTNSRMKDYFDLWILARHTDFDGETLCQAIKATLDPQKQIQWQAFLRKDALKALPLNDVVEYLADFLMPVATAASSETSFALFWNAGGPKVSSAAD